MSIVDFEAIGPSISAFHKIREIWNSDGKTQGFLFTDDPNFAEIFKNAKTEHDKMIEKLVEIREKLENSEGNEQILGKSQELYMVCDGFRSMIDEVEVEESAIRYINEIDKIYAEIMNLVVKT